MADKFSEFSTVEEYLTYDSLLKGLTKLIDLELPKLSKMIIIAEYKDSAIEAYRYGFTDLEAAGAAMYAQSIFLGLRDSYAEDEEDDISGVVDEDQDSI